MTRELSRDARRTAKEGPSGIARRQRDRLAELVAFARENSPYYRELYDGLPDRVEDPALLPVTDKPRLMARFDDWVTDRRVTREKVEAFVSDPALVGHRFLDEYLVATSSGTSGLRGLYVMDEHYTGMDMVLASRASGALSAGDAIRLLARGGRTAVVAAPNGHFFTVAGTRRFQLDHPRLGRRMRIFSIDRPIPELVAELSRFDPGMVSGFLGTLLLLAGEQEAGRLAIRPAVIVPGGETLSAEVRDRLARVFKAKVRAAYAATECSYLAGGCEEGWYHVNSDWAILEPVDAEYRPTPPGEWSHTVLLSNLANRVQPFLRYDLGDSVMLRPSPCPCGRIFPAVRVQGRAVDLLSLPGADGETVALSPMLFGTLLDKVPGLQQYQLIQSAPDTLRVRLRGDDGVWDEVRRELTQLLVEHKIVGVTIEHADEPPQQEPGGKFRRVVPLKR
ncbi:phenylacetate--CoA ligase family protein [Kribbella sp. WER1]